MDHLTVAALKYRRLVARHGPRLAAALALVGLAVAAGSAVHLAAPPTETVTETVEEGRIDTSVTTGATATGETRFYDRGAELDDEPVYMKRSAPELTVTAGTAVSGDGSATVEQSLVLVYRAEAGGETFWTRSERLASEETTVDGGEATVTATVNVTAVEAQLDDYKRALGGEGSVSAVLRHEVHYRTDSREGDLANAAPLTFGGRTYQLGDGIAGTRELSSERTREVPDSEANVVVSLAGVTVALPKTGLAGLGLAAVLFVTARDVWTRHRRGVDVTAVERRLSRVQFEEWVSHGRVPVDAGTHRVPVASLEDLVDIAIDCDRRVVYDRSRELHAVLDGDVVYYYGTVADWERTEFAVDESEFEFLSEDELQQ